jgi:hypothetical protein
MAAGMYVGADGDDSGYTGLRIGDGYHDYLNTAIVSCNCKNAIQGRSVLGAELRIRASRVYKRNPFIGGATTIRVDMVGCTLVRRFWAACERAGWRSVWGI